MTLYPCTGVETGSQDSLNLVYHSSDTRRFLGLSRPTGRDRAHVKSAHFWSSQEICISAISSDLW